MDIINNTSIFVFLKHDILVEMMKHLFRVLALLLLFASCQGPRRDAQRMEAALLQGDTLYCEIAVDEEDLSEVFDSVVPNPELERAAFYFAGKRDYARAARAALYSGYVQQYYQEKAEAMQSYKEAEQYGTLVGDSLVVAKARYKMGRMLFDDGRKRESLVVLKNADLGFSDYHYYEKAMIQNLMAASYMMLAQYDSAELCLQNSLKYAEKGRSSKARIKVLNNYSVLYQQKKEYDSAINCLKQFLDDSNLDNSELLMCYLNMGRVFMSLREVDSADFYCHRMEEVLPYAKVRKGTILTAYGLVIQVAEAQGNDSLALRYRDMHEDLVYELMRQRQDQTVFRIQQKYDYEHLQNMMNVKLVRIQRFVAIGLVLLFAIIVFFLYRSAQRNKREAEINANLFHFMHENEELLLRHEAQKKESIEKSQQLSDMLLERIHIMQRLDYYLNNQGDKRSLREVEKLLFDGKTHNEAIMEVMDVLYPGLRDTVKAKYPQMSELECEVYLLSRFKLSRIEEATLLGISTSVLDKARGKVHKWISEGQE
ncbi:MAG: tetratricopeptide repeat protein [Bacteroidales bacterium]|nr:tetratricopeptide repeat protein [Bacteroidales bacterium]